MQSDLDSKKEKESMEVFSKTFDSDKYMTLEEIENIMREKHKLYINTQES